MVPEQLEVPMATVGTLQSGEHLKSISITALYIT